MTVDEFVALIAAGLIVGWFVSGLVARHYASRRYHNALLDEAARVGNGVKMLVIQGRIHSSLQAIWMSDCIWAAAAMSGIDRIIGRPLYTVPILILLNLFVVLFVVKNRDQDRTDRQVLEMLIALEGHTPR